MTLVRLVQPLNAPRQPAWYRGPSNRLVTPSGTVTLVSVLFQAKEPSAIVVTSIPLMELGIVTSPPGPLYPVIVSAPLLFV